MAQESSNIRQCMQCGVANRENCELCMVVYEESFPQVPEQQILGIPISNEQFDSISFEQRENNFDYGEFNEEQEIVGYNITEEEFQEIPEVDVPEFEPQNELEQDDSIEENVAPGNPHRQALRDLRVPEDHNYCMDEIDEGYESPCDADLQVYVPLPPIEIVEINENNEIIEEYVAPVSPDVSMEANYDEESNNGIEEMDELNFLDFLEVQLHEDELNEIEINHEPFLYDEDNEE